MCIMHQGKDPPGLEGPVPHGAHALHCKTSTKDHVTAPQQTTMRYCHKMATTICLHNPLCSTAPALPTPLAHMCTNGGEEKR